MNKTATTTKTPAKAKLTPCVIHARSTEEAEILKRRFNFEKSGLKPTGQVIVGIKSAQQMELAVASAKGTTIVSTGLPCDVASKLETTHINVRAWEKTNEETGSTSSGSSDPITFGVLDIKDREAYARLVKNPDFLKAIGKAPSEEDPA